MPATVAADFSFAPKVWQDHIMAYFDRKLVFGAFALRDDSLTAEPGLTQNFPYFQKIGAAEKPAEDEGLQVDQLTDNSFSVTVGEVAKAVGVTKKAFYSSAARRERILQECQEQLGRVIAEQIDADLLTVFSASGAYSTGYTSSNSQADFMNIRTLNKGKIIAFGDKHKDAQVLFMHSHQLMDMLADTTAGFLVANALDPMFLVEGFEGRLNGMAIVVDDNMPLNVAGQLNSSNVYDAFIHKRNAYGFMVKQDMEVEQDYDMLHRQWVVAATEWYGCLSFHQTISSQFLKTALLRVQVSA
jgi:N4-gp56 family major capsid protein